MIIKKLNNKSNLRQKVYSEFKIMESKVKNLIIKRIKKEQKKAIKLYEKSLKDKTNEMFIPDFYLGCYDCFEFAINLIQNTN